MGDNSNFIARFFDHMMAVQYRSTNRKSNITIEQSIQWSIHGLELQLMTDLDVHHRL